MSTFDLTPHAIVRMSQRGVRLADIELVELIGTEVEGGLYVRRKDVLAFVRHLTSLGDRARRLLGKRLVIENDAVVTVYRARKRKERRLLRSADDL